MINESEAFILHRQNYSESSKILRCLTHDYGRVDILCKGCRNSGKRARVLEPFRSYRLSWSGKSDLKTLRQSDEAEIYAMTSEPDRLYCGFYINELLSQIIRPGEAEPDLYNLYKNMLAQMTSCPLSSVNGLLRRFELSLLQQMGYGVSLEYEKDGRTPIDPKLTYGYEPDHGLYQTNSSQRVLVSGESIMALQNGKFEDQRQEREAKQLMRFILGHYLPQTSIQSRKLFA